MTELITLPGPHGTQPLPATRRVAHARAERIRLRIIDYTHLLKDIADAFHQRDWHTLGYQSWEAYVEGEFGGQRISLDRARRELAVANLREEGLSTRAIASALGVNQSTVVRDLGASDADASLAEVTGVNGKRYAATQPERAPETPPSAGEHTDHRASAEGSLAGDAGGPTQPPAADPAGDGQRIALTEAGSAPQTAGASVPAPAAGPAPIPPAGPAPQSDLMPRPTPEALDRHSRERDEQTSREVASKNLARSVWLLAQAAEVTGAVDLMLTDWQPSQDIYPKPTTAERMRAAAEYLHALAERWPQ